MTASERIREARLKKVEAKCTTKQIEAIGMLHSIVDNLDYELDSNHIPNSYHVTDLVFTGEGQDGPCSGYIKPDGTVDWLVEA